MKITEQTATTLKLTDQNQQWLFGTLFSLPFLTIGLVMIGTSSNLTTLTCDRQPPNRILCQRTITGWLGSRTMPLPGTLAGASAVTAHATGVVLHTTQGEVELANHHLSFLVRDRERENADAINAFVKNPQQLRLVVRQDDRWQELIAGTSFLLPGLAVMLMTLTIPVQTHCFFDRSTGLMTLKCQYRFLGTRQFNCPLGEIQATQIVQSANTTRNPVYVVKLQLRSKKWINVSPLTRDRQQCQLWVNAINHLVGCRQH